MIWWDEERPYNPERTQAWIRNARLLGRTISLRYVPHGSGRIYMEAKAMGSWYVLSYVEPEQADAAKQLARIRYGLEY